jgi:hypothetical protein
VTGNAVRSDIARCISDTLACSRVTFLKNPIDESAGP